MRWNMSGVRFWEDRKAVCAGRAGRSEHPLEAEAEPVVLAPAPRALFLGKSAILP